MKSPAVYSEMTTNTIPYAYDYGHDVVQKQATTSEFKVNHHQLNDESALLDETNISKASKVSPINHSQNSQQLQH